MLHTGSVTLHVAIPWCPRSQCSCLLPAVPKAVLVQIFRHTVYRNVRDWWRMYGGGLLSGGDVDSKHWFTTSFLLAEGARKSILYSLCICSSQIPSTGLRHPSSRRKVPESDVQSVCSSINLHPCRLSDQRYCSKCSVVSQKALVSTVATGTHFCLVGFRPGQGDLACCACP